MLTHDMLQRYSKLIVSEEWRPTHHTSHILECTLKSLDLINSSVPSYHSDCIQIYLNSNWCWLIHTKVSVCNTPLIDWHWLIISSANELVHNTLIHVKYKLLFIFTKINFFQPQLYTQCRYSNYHSL